MIGSSQEQKVFNLSSFMFDKATAEHRLHNEQLLEKVKCAYTQKKNKIKLTVKQ